MQLGIEISFWVLAAPDASCRFLASVKNVGEKGNNRGYKESPSVNMRSNTERFVCDKPTYLLHSLFCNSCFVRVAVGILISRRSGVRVGRRVVVVSVVLTSSKRVYTIPPRLAAAIFLSSFPPANHASVRPSVTLRTGRDLRRQSFLTCREELNARSLRAFRKSTFSQLQNIRLLCGLLGAKRLLCSE